MPGGKKIIYFTHRTNRDGCCEIPDIRVPVMTYPAVAMSHVGRYAWQAVFYSDAVEVQKPGGI